MLLGKNFLRARQSTHKLYKFFSIKNQSDQNQQINKVKIIIDSHFIRAQLNLTGVKPIWFSFGNYILSII